jgi:hypothetical protein
MFHLLGMKRCKWLKIDGYDALDEPAALGRGNHLTYNLQDEGHFHVKTSEWFSTVFGDRLIQYKNPHGIPKN